MIKITETKNGVILTIKAVPGSSKDAIAGILGDMLKIKVSAAPEKGKANKSIIALLSKELGIAKKDIEIINGSTAAVKQIQITGVSSEDILSIV